MTIINTDLQHRRACQTVQILIAQQQNLLAQCSHPAEKITTFEHKNYLQHEILQFSNSEFKTIRPELQRCSAR